MSGAKALSLTAGDAAGALSSVRRVAVDLEANGMFAYRASLCVLQLAAGDRVWLLDGLRADLAPLAELLGPAGPVKVVHDVSFDARLLAEKGLPLGNVHDTSISARMLGATSTGLSSLLGALLGVTMEKALQQHDWAARPLLPEHLAYLERDVAHLEALDDALWERVCAAGIEEEVLEETRYRLAQAECAVRSSAPPAFARIKGFERLRERDAVVLRGLAEVREREAERRNVPVHRVIPGDSLLAIARSRPSSVAELRRKGPPIDDGLAYALLSAVESGARETAALADDERAWLTPVRLPPAVVKLRRDREARLMAWRRAEAERRGVDEQVVLPGHCVKDLAAGDEQGRTPRELASVPGFGAFREARYGDALRRLLEEPAGGGA